VRIANLVNFIQFIVVYRLGIHQRLRYTYNYRDNEYDFEIISC